MSDTTMRAHILTNENRQKAWAWLQAYGFDEMSADVYRKPRNARSAAVDAVMANVCSSIYRYGEDGMGDKPADMDVFEYWLAHVNYDALKRMRFKPRWP